MYSNEEAIALRLQSLKTPQTYTNLAKYFLVSETTVRRVLRKLLKEGKVRRIDGYRGVVYWTWNWRYKDDHNNQQTE